LSENIPYRFFISSIKDDKLGNKLILLIESKEYQIQQKVFHKLNKYEIPKKIMFLDYFVETHNNKIDRINTLLKIKL
jgi:O-succinylbenzoic acid--CoA ligase